MDFPIQISIEGISQPPKVAAASLRRPNMAINYSMSTIFESRSNNVITSFP